jgi:hypothetical protein
VIHDFAVPQKLLNLVKPSHYREAGPPYWAIGRAIHPAEDGWRVVHLVEGSTMERAIECAAHCCGAGKIPIFASQRPGIGA